MYAVVKTGGKQYRVEPGNVLDVERIEGSVGNVVTFSEVLLVEKDGKVTLGKPAVKGASVTAHITAQKRGPKLVIFKKLRRHGQQLKKGHRQELTTVRIESIVGV
jgi:large subunit ribosomal protein L21